MKGVKFQGLRDVGDPVELGAAYSDAGADELVFLDISATVDAGVSAVDVAARVAEQVTIPFTFGGGIRTLDDATAVLEAGADKIERQLGGAGAAGADRGARTRAREPGGRRRDRHGGRPRTLPRSDARRVHATPSNGRASAKQRGAGELLVTSIDRDGTQNGYDLELLAQAA